MHTVTIYPIGNADSYTLDLADGRKMLFDYSHLKCAEGETDKRIDLAKALRDRLAEQGRDAFDVVTFTHLDKDHVGGAPALFYLEHSEAHQDGDRIKISDLWVPAAAIYEDIETLGEDAVIIQAEAQYRLRKGSGVRVFSRPQALEDWLAKEGLTVEDRADLISDAGTLIPGFELAAHGVEWFVHSPFATWCDGTIVERNNLAVVLQATFLVDGRTSRLLLSADSPFDLLAEMVNTTKQHGNEQRLEWDLFKLPHHGSYLSLNVEKGKDKTEPVPELEWLFEQGNSGAIMVQTSDPVPTVDTDQPPHYQAANFYRSVRDRLGGEYVVTMEHPSERAPEPLIITIGRLGIRREKRIVPPTVIIPSQDSPRAG